MCQVVTSPKVHLANICSVWTVFPSALALAFGRLLGLAMAEHTVKARDALSLKTLARVIKLDEVQLCCDT